MLRDWIGPKSRRPRSSTTVDRWRQLGWEPLECRRVLAPAFPEFIDPNPNPGNQFGQHVVPLNTGNVVITSPHDDAGGTDAGAVYLFNGETGELISTLIGSSPNDNVGSYGVTELTNGNYVVRSLLWDNIGAVNAGAVTFGNGHSGVTGVVSAANSLVGTTTNDNIGSGGVTPLTGGNYVVQSSVWDNNAATDAGAVTFGSGTNGITGVVSASNSLVGSFTGDRVGIGIGSGINGVTVLTGGNYVVRSPFWKNGEVNDAGAVTFGSGTSGVAGAVSAANSLVGSTTRDRVGSDSVTALTNGNYVVVSHNWNNGAAFDAGAVTFGSGTDGVTGTVSAFNSLVGSTTGDWVGSGGVTALTNGNYVVVSHDWNNGAVDDAGAVTFGSGTSGVTGTVSAENSLVGTASDDRVGFNGVTALTNGNYVVASRVWDNGFITDAGAVTFGNGASGVTGEVSAANSLVGSTNGDAIGSYGVTPLTNGNYLVKIPSWDNATDTNVGAVTFGSGTSGVAGTVSAANSLVGSTSGDAIGSYGVTLLTNGNYVIQSPSWDNGAVINAGAITFGSGVSGVAGVVSVANSLVGSTSSDRVGSGRLTFGPNGGVTPLTNGNFVVESPYWDNGGETEAGAVTWGSGTSGVTGIVSAANSLIGSTSNDLVGSSGVTALANGNYLVISPNWDSNTATDAGAVTFGNGTSGLTGAVSAANSLVGTTSSDQIGSFGVTALTNGNYVVLSPHWGTGSEANAGAVTFGNGNSGVTGVVSVANSLVNSSTVFVTALTNGNYVARSSFWDNGVTENSGAVAFGNGTSGVTGLINTSNSMIGNTANTALQPVVTDDVNGHFFGRFLSEGGGRVRVGSQVDGFAQPTPAIEGRIALYKEPGTDNWSASGKLPLVAGETAGFINFTNYVHGINGLAIDIAGLPDPSAITPADFTFRTGTTDDTSSWTIVPVDPTLTLRLGEGVAGSDRLTLTWPDGTITNTWLEVTVKANGNTGLATDDTFYFGNQIGDTNGDGQTNATDFAAIRANPSTFLNPAAVDNAFDLNRDGRVNASDLAIVREHATPLDGGLPMITPGGQAFAARAFAAKAFAGKSESLELLIPPADLFNEQNRAEKKQSTSIIERAVESQSSASAEESLDQAIILLASENPTRQYEGHGFSSATDEEADLLRLDLWNLSDAES